MAPRAKCLELTVDGTNFGGKTPLVTVIARKLAERGSVECCNPFKVQSVDLYPLWAESPVEAAQRVADCMRRHREASQVDFFIWDRGWPTVHMVTRNAEARALVPPSTPTFFLLNTNATTAAKVQKYSLTPVTHPWMCGARLPDETSYEQLAVEHADCIARTFRPDAGGVFDLEAVAGAIITVTLQMRGLL